MPTNGTGYLLRLHSCDKRIQRDSRNSQESAASHAWQKRKPSEEIVRKVRRFVAQERALKMESGLRDEILKREGIQSPKGGALLEAVEGSRFMAGQRSRLPEPDSDVGGLDCGDAVGF